MKVYITDNSKIVDYALPTKIEDSFLIEFITTTGVEESIILTAENGAWTISSNIDTTITNGVTKIEKDILKDNACYQIQFSDLEEIVKMYCIETPVIYQNFQVPNKDVITLGRQNADISYNAVGIGETHFKIKRASNEWILEGNEDNTLVTFVNGKRYKKSNLQLGDVIFTNGLKIIWMNTFIKINNPNNLVQVASEKYEKFNMVGSENNYTQVKETEKAITLYNENQVFFHTPSLKKTIEEKEIEIINPPQKRTNDEPPAILTLGSTIIMGISSSLTGLMAVFTLTRKDGNIFSALIEIVICIATLLGSIAFPILLNKYNKNKIKKQEQKRQKKYSEYLNEKRQEIKNELEKEKMILYENNLSLKEITQNIINKKSLWNREIQDSDFLNLRLGIGNRKSYIKVKAKIEEFSLEDDNLREEVEKIIKTPLVLEQVPITISLIEDRILPLIISPTFLYKQQLIDSLILQLITYCSGMDLKIVILTDEKNKDNWNYLKYLSHLCSQDKNTHFFATNDEERKQVSIYLESIYNDRLNHSNLLAEDKKRTEDIEENVYKNYDEYYLIITDTFITAKKLGIIEKIINSTVNLGFSLLTIESSLQNVPSKSTKFISINDNTGTISGKDLNNGECLSFVVECINNSSIVETYSELIANIPVSFKSSSLSLPNSISFLETYKVGKIEQLNIVNKWTKNDPTLSLQAPIGINEEGKLFYLDLHEKFQGPHGLIAGSTGSGKSEFIITYILSMAINYHPYEVQFVLIDYKGGGLAGAFENRETGIKIPHLVGTITNLDEAEMNRTLVSIKSELKRRQRLFNEARDTLGESTVDIYKYQKYYRKGQVKEPISHLFIISDEFAELKSQQPDFMNELISTARIGRSLGVHLILATQKPSGVVDDQIWSNSRFKVCLKVQTPEDSNELLKRPEAATIKETGRFYLQVGYNETFELGQSAWAGARYTPTDRIIKNIDDDIKFINNNGDTIKIVNDKAKENLDKDYGDQLTNIVKSLYNIALRENIQFKSLWLPSIPKEIYIGNLAKKYNYVAHPYEICPILGEYDIPAEQLQKLLTIDFTNTGNLIIYGNAGSGKENMLTTLIYSTCIYHSPEEVNFYIYDFGAETLQIFQDFPHVGDIILSDSMKKIVNAFQMIEKEVNRRKELFSGYGGNYTSYIKTSGKTLPFIINILNGYESFVENLGNYEDYYSSLLRESSKYGIIFVMTASAVNNIQMRISQSCVNKMAMQLTEVIEYRYTLNAPYGLLPAKYFGRGIISVDDTAYEFQTAFVYLKEQINDYIKQTSNKLNQVYQIKARKIPIIPKVVDLDLMIYNLEDINNVPIGINMYDGSVCKYDFAKNQILPVVGKTILSESGFLKDLIQLFLSVPNIQVSVIDFSLTLNSMEGNVTYYNNEFTKAINQIAPKTSKDDIKNYYFLIGIGSIYDRVLDEGIASLFNIFNNKEQSSNNYFIIIDNYISYRKIINEQWYQSLEHNNGIWYGNGIEMQNIIEIEKLQKSDISEITKDTLFVVENGNYKVVKTMSNKEEDGYYE